MEDKNTEESEKGFIKLNVMTPKEFQDYMEADVVSQKFRSITQGIINTIFLKIKKNYGTDNDCIDKNGNKYTVKISLNQSLKSHLKTLLDIVIINLEENSWNVKIQPDVDETLTRLTRLSKNSYNNNKRIKILNEYYVNKYQLPKDSQYQLNDYFGELTKMAIRDRELKYQEEMHFLVTMTPKSNQYIYNLK